MTHLDRFIHQAVGCHHIVDRAAELAGHFQSALKRQRKAFRIAQAQIARLRMVEGVARIMIAGGNVVLFEASVCEHTVANVALDGCPIRVSCDAPIFGQLNPYFRNGAGIDAKRLATGTQRLILQLHGALLGSYGKTNKAIFNVGIELLQSCRALIIIAHGNVCTIADAPLMQRILSRIAGDGSAESAVTLIGRCESVAVGRKPKRCVSAAGRHLYLGLILQFVARTLPCVLRKC